MRHAFGDHVTRHAGITNAQALLGHADVGTTQMYTGAPTLDELAAAIEGYRFGVRRTDVPVDPRNAARGADRNRTGVHGFAGRCVATPPRRRGRGTW